MKLTYLAQIGLLDDWAHTIQILKMCEAFSQNGAEVTLLVAKRKNPTNKNPFDNYGISRTFKIKEVPYLDINTGSTSAFLYYIRLFSFLFSARFFLFFYKYDVLYTRELNASLFFRNVYLEKHTFPDNPGFFQKVFLKKIAGFIVLTSFIKSKLSLLGISESKIIVAHDAVRLEDFKKSHSKSEDRILFGLSDQDIVFGYVGTLRTMGMEKGLKTAINSLVFLPKEYKLFVVGGEAEDINYYKKYSTEKGVESRVVFRGKINHKDIPAHINVCDVVVAPFPENQHYSYYMSPLKIFEYMASKVPIVVTDLPSLKEVLVNERTALFIPPDGDRDLAIAIQRIVSDKNLSLNLSENAYNEVRDKYTWSKRAEHILNYIKS